MQCCGQDRTSKFCPDCGSQLSDSSLFTLLAYVRQRQKIITKNIQNGMNRDSVASARKIAKWQAWADELEKAIVALEEKDDGKTTDTR